MIYRRLFRPSATGSIIFIFLLFCNIFSIPIYSSPNIVFRNSDDFLVYEGIDGLSPLDSANTSDFLPNFFPDYRRSSNVSDQTNSYFRDPSFFARSHKNELDPVLYSHSLISSVGESTFSSSSDVSSFNDHFYQFFSIQQTWLQAISSCEGFGGYLVTITSSAENAFVNSLADFNTIWISLTDDRIEGEWEWITGENVSFTRWDIGEPNDADGEDCGEMVPNGEWNDIGSPSAPDMTNFFVCEWDFEYFNDSDEPLLIKGNADFHETAVTRDWGGNGTVSNPYIIENLTISVFPDESSIQIINTDVNFLLRNCILSSGSTGILLSNVTNGYIHNSTILHASDAISVQNSSNCVFIGNNLTSSIPGSGVVLFWSPNNSFINNSFTNYGLALLWSGNNTVIGNNFTNSGLSIFGSFLSHYLQVRVSGNVVNGRSIIFWQNQHNMPSPVDSGQIILVNCSHIDILNLTISDVGNGITIFFSRFVTIQNNNVSNIKGYVGIVLVSSTNCSVRNNSLFDNARWGLHVVRSENVTLVNNTAFGNGWNGISVENSLFITLSQNNCSFGQQSGISLVNISFSLITGNNCSANALSGIEFWESSHSTLIDNFVHRNQEHGFLIENTRFNLFLCNNVSENGYSGINQGSSLSNDFLNNSIENNHEEGVYFWDSQDINLSNNLVYMNGYSEIMSRNCQVFIIDHNIITPDRSYVVGIRLFDAVDGIVSNNFISVGDVGILVENSLNCSFIMNHIFSYFLTEGLKFFWSTTNLIFNNSFVGSSLVFLWSGNNFVVNNTFLNYGIGILGDSLAHFVQASVVNNVVNGKAIIFWQFESDRIVPSNAGQVFLISCSRITVGGLILSILNDVIISAFCSDVVIQNNIISGTSYVGIGVYYSTNSIVSENEILNNYGTGIRVSGSIDISIRDNSIWGSGQIGIFVDFSTLLTISNNLCSSNGEHGLLFANCNNSVITGNIWRDNNWSGIEFHENLIIILSNNIIESNRYYGIFLDNSDEISFTSNSITSNLFGGILLDIARIITISANIFTANQNGIFFSSVSNSLITKCIFTENNDYALFFDQHCNSNEVTLNDFLGNNLWGFSQAFDDGEDNVIWNNYWNDWLTPDANDNGFVDDPYPLDEATSNFDPYPRTLSSQISPPQRIPQNVIFGVFLILLIVVVLRYLPRKSD